MIVNSTFATVIVVTFVNSILNVLLSYAVMLLDLTLKLKEATHNIINGSRFFNLLLAFVFLQINLVRPWLIILISCRILFYHLL